MSCALDGLRAWRSTGRLRGLWLAPAPVPFFGPAGAPPPAAEAPGIAAARARLHDAFRLRDILGG